MFNALRDLISPPRYRLICPYCLEENRYRQKPMNCAKCGQSLPPIYVDNFDSAPPLFLQVVGWQQTGKTVYLDGLTHMLNQITVVWERYATMAATEESQERTRRLNILLETGELPPPTLSGGSDQVYIMCLLGMPRWGGRTLVLRDYGGELFQPMQFPDVEVPYVSQSPTVLMFVSLADKMEGRTMNMLLNNYIHTLLNKGIDIRKQKRNVVLVFTKGDKLHDLPASLRSYLTNDPLLTATQPSLATPPWMDAAALQGYLEKMNETSHEIREWMRRRDPGAQNFESLALQYQMNMRFTLVSSLGADVPPNKGIRQEIFAPRRVLDPFFWALELGLNYQ